MGTILQLLHAAAKYGGPTYRSLKGWARVGRLPRQQLSLNNPFGGGPLDDRCIIVLDRRPLAAQPRSHAKSRRRLFVRIFTMRRVRSLCAPANNSDRSHSE